MSWRDGHGARAVIPARASPSGKPVGNMAWRRRAADGLVPREMRRRSVRGGEIQSLPLEVRAGAQKGRMGENAHGRRAAAGYVIGAPRRAFGGHVPARRPGLVAHEIARKAIIYNAACP